MCAGEKTLNAHARTGVQIEKNKKKRKKINAPTVMAVLGCCTGATQL